ncbi:IS110 family transposase [Streptomyces sp. NPDC006476]|uniref:IS110 family transposase n=1 Tax=Streptomyces sp. NPDC006476 TaxID=3157175 RepID=UPI00339F58ED
MVRHYLDEIDRFKSAVTVFDTRIADLLAEREHELDLLDSLPGIGRMAAEIILAETGGDMNQFPTAGHLASWIGVCPGQNESAGVSKSGTTRPGNSNLKRLLGVAAMAAIRNKDTYLAAYFRRISARRGGKRAVVAVMHRLPGTTARHRCTDVPQGRGAPWVHGNRSLFSANPRVHRCASGQWIRGFGCNARMLS